MSTKTKVPKLYKQKKPKRPTVQLYSHGRFIMDVKFEKKWHAWLFHLMLNKSVYQDGVREY